MNGVSKLFSLDEMMAMLDGFLPKLVAGLFVLAVFWVGLRIMRPPLRLRWSPPRARWASTWRLR